MARRIASSTINWGALAERIPEGERNLLVAFRTKSDQYLRRMLANPESAPKIDWAFYKKNVPIAGMVDKFQKEYEALKVPYPADNYTAKVEAQEKEVMAAVKQFIEESNRRIESYNAEASKLKSLIPFEEMTLEDYRDAFPEQALDPINKPTFWPHLPEDQLGAKPADAGHH